jgi:hypothetical protein
MVRIWVERGALLVKHIPCVKDTIKAVLPRAETTFLKPVEGIGTTLVIALQMAEMCVSKDGQMNGVHLEP